MCIPIPGYSLGVERSCLHLAKLFSAKEVDRSSTVCGSKTDYKPVQGCPFGNFPSQKAKKSLSGLGNSLFERANPACRSDHYSSVPLQPTVSCRGSGGSRRHTGATAATGHCWTSKIQHIITRSYESTRKYQQHASDYEHVRRARKSADWAGSVPFAAFVHVDRRPATSSRLKSMTTIRSKVAREAERLSNNTCDSG